MGQVQTLQEIHLQVVVQAANQDQTGQDLVILCMVIQAVQALVLLHKQEVLIMVVLHLNTHKLVTIIYQ